MKTSVCTLFEGDYHYGVGALVNSLHAAGFSGCVWAGYKGSLPPWAKVDAQGMMKVTDGLEIRFVSLATEWHLTNYKPTFMRELWEREGRDWSALFYFDPDIVVKAKWDEFAFWVQCGVAVVEDGMNGRIGSTHPLRARWKAYVAGMDLTCRREFEAFCNGGFMGISRANRSFLDTWEKLLKGIFPQFGIDPKEFMCGGTKTRVFPFQGTDQDTLNIALMVHEGSISMVGPEGMDFDEGGYLMSHAVASPKPWRRSWLMEMIKGNLPSQAIRRYWLNAENPIRLYSKYYVYCQQVLLKGSAFIGRFYGK